MQTNNLTAWGLQVRESINLGLDGLGSCLRTSRLRIVIYIVASEFPVNAPSNNICEMLAIEDFAGVSDEL